MTHQSGIPTNGAEQRRHTPRQKMFEPVTLRVRGAETRAHLLDLSLSGALAHCETPPSANSYVSVELFGLVTSGRIMWVKGKRFGIQFSQPLTQAEMDALILRA